ncbi:uncharacterized protein LOC119502106 isoform X1 [Sebastes umbrosus]|uniref:uncharacterized protein LOC119502106 isoform X1 n=1 Tax=Sebastes umbrosus TaxID=72105 RepID=UPI00189F4199|nr:uncharacterized protein LOC119502106 isoform X1 [Sebastes umbrosus]XP_037648913.1 uncharacterized protein LOC119502106 isoform X1 [Sebastes umbrosus]
MADSWLMWVLAVAIFVSMVLLAVVCLQCRDNGPLVIRQVASEDYMQSNEFRVIHPSQPSTDPNSIHLPSNHLSPFSLDPGAQRGPSHSFTETESNPSYENPVDGPDYINESDPEDPGYIIVLPEGETRPTDQSRASTPSSDFLHDYENVPEKKVSPEDRDYLNVEPPCFQTGSTPDLSAQSDSDDDDDDEGNYVNVNEGTQTN